jgi:hypothetical protein
MSRPLTGANARRRRCCDSRLSSPRRRVFSPLRPSTWVAVVVVCAIAGAAPLAGCRDRNADLFAACQAGDVDRIKILLDRGADVNARNRNGETPIMVAAGLLYPDAVRLLIARGADVNAENSRGDTALAVALGTRVPEGSPDVESDLDKVVEILVRGGATR